jgi:hypothetical protein
MSAATEYYGYLLSQGYGEHQINKFADYAKRADRGEISHNQAYKMACQAGFGSADGEDGESKRSFGDWMQTAQEQGWIDQGLSIISGIAQGGNRRPVSRPTSRPYNPPPKKSKAPLYIIGGLAVVGVGLAIYFATKKK